MAEFEVGGVAYKSRKMDAKRSFHVMRRLMPVLVSFKDLIPAIKAGGGKVDLASADMVGLLESASHAIAGLKDEDCDYILDACLALVQRKGPEGGWHAVWNSAAGMPQYQDITMPAMLQIAMNVIVDALGSFGPSLVPGSSDGAQA